MLDHSKRDLMNLVTDFVFYMFEVTETWLKPSDPSDAYAIPGYTFIRCDRQGHHGGGAAVYVREGIMCE